MYLKETKGLDLMVIQYSSWKRLWAGHVDKVVPGRDKLAGLLVISKRYRGRPFWWLYSRNS
jgi:hypothetical protein